MFRFRLGTSLFQMRRCYVVFGIIVVVSVLTTIYVLPSMRTISTLKTSTVQREVIKDDFTIIEKRLDKIEKELQRSRNMVAVLKSSLKNWIKVEPPSDNSFIAIDDNINMSAAQLCIFYPEKCHTPKQRFVIYTEFNRTAKMGNTDCSFCTLCPLAPATDENTYEIYKQIDFQNTDGGVWKQGWDLEYDPKYWNKNKKLKIFVVPHSHNDPGWIKTFEKYYTDQTQHILNNMVLKMKDDKRRKFIWAEISFFAQWWEKIDKKTQSIVKKLINEGQLEMVTGGWVMNDEATAHYFAIIEQMFEGHQWLQQNLGFKPKSAWAIDPFGLSSTMPYLLTQMGLNNMVIQRVHYSVKKYLASHKRLEFVWQQSWERRSESNTQSGIFCHIMPFYSYDIPHTCGPDPKVCCQFDFKRLPGNRVNCPWKKPPVAITDKNVAERASTLLDQYRKKSLLFKSDVVMIQLGDDFRYDKASEWDQQFNNYQKLFDYINNQEDWNAEVQFGTLSDYFTTLQRDMQVSDTNMSKEFPTLSGDFFTYADRDEHYWSGFFTSRPFYKNMDRALEAHLRAAEILFSLALAKIDEETVLSINPYISSLMTDLISSTRTLSLFQHHDAITGTARDHVVVDYALKMSVAFQKLRHIIGQCAVFLLASNTHEAVDEEIALLQTDEYRHHNSLPTKKTINFPENFTIRQIVLFNSLGYSRKELIKVIVTEEIAKVSDQNGNFIHFQVSPVYIKDNKGTDFELTFVAELPALSLKIYNIHALSRKDLLPGLSLFYSKVYINLKRKEEEQNKPKKDSTFTVEKESSHFQSKEEFTLHTPYMRAYFNGSTGMLKQIKYFNVRKDRFFTVDVDIKFFKYGTKNKGKDKSGAYLFLPDGEAKEVDYGKPYIRVIEGPLYSECIIILREVEHHVILKNSPGIDGIGLHIYNIINIASEYNKELVMRFVTNINNDEQEFFTDLNGFQMSKRRYFSKLPLQANVYPVTSIAYMEDSEKRFTFLTAHSVGVTCLQKGVLDVFLDRRLNQDDNRGLQQGITDNKDTPAHFQIFFEHWDNSLGQSNGYYPSLLAHHASLSVLHPIFVLIRLHTETDPTFVLRNPDIQLESTYSPMQYDMPCNIHILNLKPLSTPTNSGFIPAGSSVLNLHHLGYDCFFEMLGNCSTGNKNLSIHRIFPDLFGKDAEETSLSLLYSGRKIPRNQSFHVPHMEIVTFKLSHK